MKRVHLLLIAVLFLSFTSSYSQDLKGFSQEKNMTFFGVDYTQALFIGSEGFNDTEKIATEYPGIWNNLFQKEVNKFSLKKYLYKDDIYNSLKVIDNVNSKITKEDLEPRLINTIDDSKLLTLDKAKEIALGYSFKSTKNKYGAVVVFILNDIMLIF